LYKVLEGFAAIWDVFAVTDPHVTQRQWKPFQQSQNLTIELKVN
jgi:hypothetical protein